MKKLQVKAFELGNTEVLSREQMKKVLGGTAAGTTGAGGIYCSNDIDCRVFVGECYVCANGSLGLGSCISICREV